MLTEFAAHLTVGEAQQAGALAVLPLLAETLPPGPDYLTLGEALTAGTVAITEVNEGGSVPELTVVNSGDLPVLLLDGEELVGAKQNRVANTTILLKEHAKTTIPVSCVEHGRWHYASQDFQASDNVLAASLRARKGRAVSANLAQHGSRCSDQGDVWAGVAEMEHAFHTASPTGAMRDVYAHLGKDLNSLLAACTPLPGQRGMAVYLGGKIAGVEYLSQPRAFAKVYEKLLRSYALEALRLPSGKPAPVDPEAVAQLLAAAGGGKAYDAVGYGAEYRFSGAVTGSALEWQETLIHLSLLAKIAPPAGVGETMPAPFPRSFWVEPGRLLAGCYPGAVNVREADVKLRGLLYAGIRTVINLMESEETDRHDRPFQPYEDRLYRLASARGTAITCLRLAIPDHGVPTREFMRQILDAIDASLASGAPVYLHCATGRGRTGAVVGCWLARHGHAVGDDALRRLHHLRQPDPSAPATPLLNRLQTSLVRGWRQGE